MLEVLLEELPAGRPDCHVLFAGGIHDARSAAMVRGRRRRGERARDPDRRADRHRLPVHARSGRGRAPSPTTLPAGGDRRGRDRRCWRAAPGTPLAACRRRSSSSSRPRSGGCATEGAAAEDVRAASSSSSTSAGCGSRQGRRPQPRLRQRIRPPPKLAEIDRAAQWDEGMYMIGQVATMRDEVTTLAELHADVSTAAASCSQRSARSTRRRAAPPAAGRHRDRRHRPASCPAHPTPRTFWVEHPRQGRRDPRDPRTSAGTGGGHVRRRPEPPATRSTRAGAASSTRSRSTRSSSGCRRSRWPRSSRSSCWR